MKAISIAMLGWLAPAALCAQVSAQGQAAATATANTELPHRSGFSANGAAKLEATYAKAAEHRVPREPIAHRVAEGRAKGASESAILSSAAKVEA